MNRLLNNTLSTILWTLGSMLVICGVGAIWLIYPGMPSAAQNLAFQGYIVLPKADTLAILDYLTIDNSRLFVTDESSGNVYKVTLRPGMLAGENDISTFSLEPATHGVAIDPISKLAMSHEVRPIRLIPSTLIT